MSGYELLLNLGFLAFAAFIIIVIVGLKIYGDLKKAVASDTLQSAFNDTRKDSGGGE